MSWNYDSEDLNYDSEDLAYEEEVEYAYQQARERDMELDEAARQRDRDAAFDAGLDAYQERQREMAAESEEQGNREAVRSDAIPLTVTFADLVVGDYMTAESGPAARWVKVVEIESRRKWTTESDPDKLTVTFQTAQPIGVAAEDHWVIERDRTDPAVIDQRVREDEGRAA
jgi:hypothetical protein